MRATLAIAAHDKIGEGPAWDATSQRILWSDHASGLIHEAKSDGAGGWRESRRWDLGQQIAAAIPRTQGGLVVVGAVEILLLDEAEGLTSFARIAGDPERMRLNDAKCDPCGRLWTGGLSADFTPGGAALYRIDADGSVHEMLRGLTLSNGLGWSPDGSTFYLIETTSLSVEAFDFDLGRGTISNRRTLITIPRGDGGPNGMTVDHQGCLWVALTGGGEVRRYSPRGQELARVSVSTPGPTSCAFGGPDGADLFITSRSGRMPDVALKLGVRPEMMESVLPEAGGLFVCRPGVTGAPATPFAG